MNKNISFLLSFAVSVVSLMMLASAPAYASSHGDDHGVSKEVSKNKKASEEKKSSKRKKTAKAKKGYERKIDVNSASAKELTKLYGVGPKKAAEIVEYRQENGPFAKVKDLLKVKGIGQSILKKNKSMLFVAKKKK